MESRGGIPADPGARGRWLAKFRAERTCDTSRALVDLLAEAVRELDEGTPLDERLKTCKVAGELISRAVAADKHSETLEIMDLRKRSDAQRELSTELDRGLH